MNKKNDYKLFSLNYLNEKNAIIKLMNIDFFKSNFLNYILSLIKSFFYEWVAYKKYEHLIIGDNIFYNLFIAKEIINKDKDAQIFMSGVFFGSNYNKIFLSSTNLMDYILNEFNEENKYINENKIIEILSKKLENNITYSNVEDRISSTGIKTSDNYYIYSLNNVFLVDNQEYSKNENASSFKYWGLLSKKNKNNKFIHKIISKDILLKTKEVFYSSKLILAKNVYITNFPNNDRVSYSSKDNGNVEFNNKENNILLFGESKYIIKEKTSIEELIKSDLKEIKKIFEE